MKQEVWLQGNRRVLGYALVPAALLGAVGVALWAATDAAVLRAVGGAAVLASTGLVLGLLHQLRRPRIAYRDGRVLFHLRAGAPVAVPVAAVEAFFLGQGPANLPALAPPTTETVNLIARISQKHPEWEHVDVKPALGAWCNHYATLRGTWCEPLTEDVVRRLNRRLREEREAAVAASRPTAARA